MFSIALIMFYYVNFYRLYRHHLLYGTIYWSVGWFIFVIVIFYMFFIYYSDYFLQWFYRICQINSPVLPDAFKRSYKILKADQRRRREGWNKSDKIPTNNISSIKCLLVCSKYNGQLTTVRRQINHSPWIRLLLSVGQCTTHNLLDHFNHNNTDIYPLIET